MRIAIDISNINSQSIAGQAMSALNLLKGFQQISGKDIQYLVYCEKGLNENVKDSLPIAQICQTKANPFWGKANRVSVLLGYLWSLLYSEFRMPSLLKG